SPPTSRWRTTPSASGSACAARCRARCATGPRSRGRPGRRRSRRRWSSTARRPPRSASPATWSRAPPRAGARAARSARRSPSSARPTPRPSAVRSAADTMDAIEGERLDLVASELDEPPDLLEAGDDTPVIRLVNALLAQAVKDGASDIHIEPWERGLAVRFRLDGLLHDVLAPPGRLAATIASRVKIMAGLDIA